MVHENTVEEVRQASETMHEMRTLDKNLAWFLKSIQVGKEAGIQLPEKEPIAVINFIG